MQEAQRGEGLSQSHNSSGRTEGNKYLALVEGEGGQRPVLQFLRKLNSVFCVLIIEAAMFSCADCVRHKGFRPSPREELGLRSGPHGSHQGVPFLEEWEPLAICLPHMSLPVPFSSS